MSQFDEWLPSASISNIKQRAQLLKKIRGFFESQDVLEVETPILSQYGGTEPNLDPITANHQLHGLEQLGFLQTSPEFAMKRLLAAGVGDCFQIFKAFRNEESGRYHNPEFSLLEWYRTGIDEIHLLHEIDQFLQQILETEAAEYCRYSDLFQKYVGFLPQQTTLEEIKKITAKKIENPPILDRIDDYLELLFSFCIEPNLGNNSPCFVTHYPSSQASLARLSTQNPEVCCRFEIFYKGIELGNGFYELCDADEQLSRFNNENRRRQQLGLNEVTIDNRFIQALQNGLPECSGVAIGIDRLLMIITDASHIDEVVAFPISRA